MEFLGYPVDLTLLWGAIIALSVLIYVILDGFDLGLGMLFAAEKGKRDRDVMMNSIAPVWDGNETWLVLGGGGLFAAFPLAYALIFPALYVPIIFMVLALIFRGVAFEFRWRTKRWEHVWDMAFIGGSAVAALTQGITLGALLQGISVDEAARVYSGGWWDWLTPFSVTVGVAVMVGYMLLGATWLIMKTGGELQARMRARALPLGLATVAFIGVISLWTPFLQDGYYSRWFEGAGLVSALGVGGMVAAVALLMLRSLRVHHHEYQPFVLSLMLFVLCFVGLGVCMFPYIVPIEITLWEASAPDNSLIFMLIGAAINIPMIIIYTGFAYWVFRGKVDPNEGYH